MFCFPAILHMLLSAVVLYHVTHPYTPVLLLDSPSQVLYLITCGTHGPDEGSCGNYIAMLDTVNVLTGRYAHAMSVVSVAIHA